MKDIQSFEVFEKRLRASVCPEHFFGEICPLQLSVYVKKRDQEYSHFRKIISGNKNANEDYRVRIAESLFLLFDTWALQKIDMDVYGNSTTYRLKVLFMVRNYEGELHFFLMKNDSLHKPALYGGLFGDGYLHSDEVHVLRNGIPIFKGYTREYGTHGATTCFHGISKDHTSSLQASDFAEYDMIEINTWEYDSFDKFIQRFMNT